MMAGTKQVKQSILYNKVVYVAIPKRLYNDAIVTRALQLIKSYKPLAIIDPRDVFSSNEEWEKLFPGCLKPCEVCVIVTDNRIVGRGVYREWEYFKAKKKPCYGYEELGKTQAFCDVKELYVVNWNNWIDYAELVYASND